MKNKVFLWGFIIALVDQLVKLLVVSYATLNESVPIIKNFFYLSYVKNEGAAWNIFSGDRWFLIIISIIALYGIIKYFLLDIHITKLELTGYALILGGIVGNLIDRLIRGSVVDYLNFHISNYNFPVFNIADSCLVVGCFLIICHLIRGTKVSKK